MAISGWVLGGFRPGFGGHFVWGLWAFGRGVWSYFGVGFRGHRFRFELDFVGALRGILAWGLEGISGWVLGAFRPGFGGAFFLGFVGIWGCCLELFRRGV